MLDMTHRVPRSDVVLPIWGNLLVVILYWQRNQSLMPEEELFKTEEQSSRVEIAEALITAAEQIETGSVHLDSEGEEQRVTIPENPLFEVELERLTDSETGEERYELEYEIRWTK